MSALESTADVTRVLTHVTSLLIDPFSSSSLSAEVDIREIIKNNRNFKTTAGHGYKVLERVRL